jgi:uncharacterized protein YcnI
MKRFIGSLFALAMWAGLTASSQAHVQVTPLTAAPGDAVRFEFLVPNERDDVSTVAVSLQIPKDVDPFSFDDPPGWRRTLNKAGDGRIDVVRWRGRLRSDGFTEFAFLASTPQREGPITWRSTQTYADGKETAWVGPPESDEPAAVTQVDADAPRRDAGARVKAALGPKLQPMPRRPPARVVMTTIAIRWRSRSAREDWRWERSRSSSRYAGGAPASCALSAAGGCPSGA